MRRAASCRCRRSSCLVVVEALGQGHLLCVVEGSGPRVPTSSTSGPRCREPCLCPLADDVALELGEGGEDVEDQLPAAGGRVDLLGEALEADPSLLELADRLDQVGERSSEAIELPDHERVAAAGELKRLLKPGTVGLGAAGGVGERPLAAGLAEGVLLERERLFMRRNASIADSMSRSSHNPSIMSMCEMLIARQVVRQSPKGEGRPGERHEQGVS